MASPQLERRKAKDKCIRCGSQQPPIGQAVCFDCVDKMAADKQAAVTRGLCIDCWKEPARAERKCCAGCAQRRAQERKQRYARRKQAGICVQCGKAPRWEGRVLCAYCLGKKYGM